MRGWRLSSSRAGEVFAERLEVSPERCRAQRLHHVARHVQAKKLANRNGERYSVLPPVNQLPAGTVDTNHRKACGLQRVEVTVDRPQREAMAVSKNLSRHTPL
jgi:hypothetical protein